MSAASALGTHGSRWLRRDGGENQRFTGYDLAYVVGHLGSAALAGRMTYFRLRAVLAIPAGRLWRLLPAPAVQDRSHGSRWLHRDGTENQRIQKKKTPAAKSATGVFFF